MYWDLILNYNELYQKSNVDFIHNYYGSYEYGITQFQKEIEIVIKNLLEFSYLRTNIVEKTYFSFKLDNSSLVVKINMVFNKAKKTENHQIKKLSSNYNQINAIANKINGRIQIEKNSNQSQTLMFSLPVQVYSDIKNEFSSEYFTKIKKKTLQQESSPLSFLLITIKTNLKC